ncbi:peptidoglycan-associated lipoprotein Pal [bacterium]|nr:peptidoglycan-associated lipoprotein Pal [candidate division CSSED10-310 bacterium]
MFRNVSFYFVLLVVCVGLMMGGCKKKAPEQEFVPESAAPTNTPIAAPAQEEPTMEELRLIKLEEARSVLSSESVYYDYDKAVLTAEGRSILAEKAAYMIKNPDITVTIEGHCDERGSNEYNLALGERRAAAAKKYLMDFGVQGSLIETVTYGEERPVCRESKESCWKLNRRAAFVVND